MGNIKKNYIYSICYQLLVMLLPLITSPYISRVMGVEKVGIFSYTYSIVNYFLLFSMMGIANYGNRSIAFVRDNKDKVSKAFWSIYLLQVITASISLIFYLIYVIFFVKQYRNIYIIWSLVLISGMIDISWLFFGFEKFKVTITRNIIVKIISLIMIFVFIKTEDDLSKYVLIISLSTLINQLLLWPFTKKIIVFKKPTFNNIINHIKPNFILFIPVVAVSIYTIMDKIMLKNLSSIEQVGLFDNAQKITIIATGIITSLGTVMLPRMSNLYAKEENELCKKYIWISIEYIMIIAIALSFGISAVANNFVPIFFGEDFINSGPIMSLLSYTIIFIAWANVIRTQYLIPNKKDKIYVISVLLGAIVNFTINIILIPKYNSMGAAIGTICAEFIVALYQTICIRKELSIVTYIKNILSFFLVGISMFFIVKYIEIVLGKSLTVLFLQIIIGAFYYGVCTLIILYKRKNKIILNLKIKIYDRMIKDEGNLKKRY